MALNSTQEIFEKAASRSIPFWRVVLETDNLFSICAGHWTVAKVRGEFYCGDNAGKRFENWLGMHTVPLRYPLKTVKISPLEVGPMPLFPVVS